MVGRGPDVWFQAATTEMAESLENFLEGKDANRRTALAERVAAPPEEIGAGSHDTVRVRFEERDLAYRYAALPLFL